MEENNSQSLIYIIIDAIIFMLGITMILFMLSSSSDASNFVIEDIAKRNNIGQTYLEEIYEGTLSSGSLHYDGVLDGIQVISNLSNRTTKNNVTIIPHGGNAFVLSDVYHEGVQIFDYAKNVNSGVLRSYISDTGYYTRYYELNGDGELVNEIYKEGY